MELDERELRIYAKLTKANRLVAILLKNYPVTRALKTDDFVKSFRYLATDKVRDEYSFETISRSRRYVQNTLGLFPKTEPSTSWAKAIVQIQKDAQLNLFEGA